MLQVQMLSPNSIEDQKKKKGKKGLQRKLKGFCALNRVKTKEKKKEKKVFSAIWYYTYSDTIWVLFVLTATFLSIHPDAYSQW